MKEKRTFVAICYALPKLVARDIDDCRTVPMIEVTIGVLCDEDGHKYPGNFSPRWDEGTNCGGCTFRIHAFIVGDKPEVVSGMTGPDITHGNLSHYRHGVRACNRMRKGLDTLNRGPQVDAAGSLSRWLSVCGIKGNNVWLRPEGESTGWHNRGKWEQYTIRDFEMVVRSKFP